MNNTTSKLSSESGLNFNLDYKKLIRDVIQFWWLFLITIPLAIGSVYGLHRWVTPIYSASMRIIMEERGENNPQNDMMEGFGLTPGMRNVDNQIALLSSWDMVYKAIDHLDFNVSYFVKGNIKTTEIYPASNFEVEFDSLHAQLLHTPFYVKMLDDDTFELNYSGSGQGAYNYTTRNMSGGVGNQEYSELHRFGEWITSDAFRFKVICDGCKLPEDMVHYFVFNHPNTLTAKYTGILRANKMNENSSIVQLYLTGANKNKNIKFLNTLAEVFIESNLEKKNLIATNTIQFIESQLVNISDSLSNTGTELSNFRTSNRIQSISSKAEYLFDQLQEAEQEQARIVIARNYYQNLKDYFENEDFDNDVIAPALYQTDNQIISSQIQRIMELNTERLSITKPLGESINPLVEQMDLDLNLAKETLIKTIENQMKVLKEDMIRINQEKVKFEQDLYSLPETERKLLGIERKFELNNEVYTFLLRRRSEAQIQKASNTPDHQVLEAARSGGMVSPNIKGNYQKALLAGLFIPLLFLIIRQLLNNKITSVEDVEKITGLPLVGQILHSNKEETNVVKYHPKSVITETFRRVRTRLEFMVGEKSSPIVTVTSSMPGEGKTFCSLNLASVFALAGKKTILVGFDMRKPGLNKILDLNGNEGLSTYLIGKVTLEEVVIPSPSGLENLYILPSGPIPPNPSELISSPKTEKLFEQLKAEYDFIVLDSPPMGVVSDPYLLARYSDTIVFLVRHNHTIREVFAHTIQNLTNEGINNVSILLNDLNMKQGGYGSNYGYGYGYGYGHGYYEEA